MQTNPTNISQEIDADDRAAGPGARPEAANGSLWLVADVAAYLKVSRHAIYRMTARNAALRVPHVRLGRQLRFRQADIDRWLALLTVSNLDALTRMRQHVAQVTHGHTRQTQAP